MTYINHYPPLWKYLSLYPKEETPESKVERDIAYKKVLSTVAAKQEIRDKELWEADVKMEDENFVTNCNIEKDAFFASGSESEPGEVEKRPVMRDGRVPKMAKNFEKI